VVYGYGVAIVLELCLLVYCVLDVITTPEDRVRNLPKMLWLVLVLFFPLVGGVAWLVAGRPQGPARSLPYKGSSGSPAAPPRSPRRAAHPDDDEDFLRGLRERAEEQRRAARRREQEEPPQA
jgi:hypothetical protein